MRLTSVEGQKDLPRWFETFFAISQKVDTGSLEVTLPDGRVFLVEGSRPGPAGQITVLNRDFFTRLVREGDLGFSEMYLDGWWETSDLQALLDVILINNDSLGRGFPAMVLVRAYERLRYWLRSNTRRGARRNISYHYDLGNAFYQRWLDPSMTYSSALFTGQGEDLTQAQANKYASICDRIGVKPGDHLLEIGCGWGGFAEYAIRERGARVTGLTLSREQHEYASKRLFDAGLAERAEIVIRDYRDERGVYDGIASIEMFEAVGERYWPAYFRTLRERLRPGAVAGLQIITIADALFGEYRRQTDFIQKYIFPGGMLPSPGALRSEAERAGLALLGSVEFGESYSRTLREWRDRFQSEWDEICTLGFDERFRRMWNFYLASCAACFRAKTTDVTQISLQKPA